MTTGAALLQFMILPLLVLGLGVVSVLESRKAEVSLRFFPRGSSRVQIENTASAVPTVLKIISGTIVLFVTVFFIFTLILPIVSSVMRLEGIADQRDLHFLELYLQTILNTMRMMIPAGLIGLSVSLAAGFALGFFRFQGAKSILITIGSFLFVTSAVLFIAYFFFNRSFVMVWKSITGVEQYEPSYLIPFLFSPVGVLIFTWFFRGIRDETTCLSLSESAMASGSYQTRTTRLALLLAMPVGGVMLIGFLNMTVFPDVIPAGQNASAASFLNEYLSGAIDMIRRYRHFAGLYLSLIHI